MTKIRKKRVRGNESRSSRRSHQQREKLAAVLSAICCLFICGLLGVVPLPRWSGSPPPDTSPLRARKEGRRRARRGWKGLLPMRRALEEPAWNPEATALAQDILSAETQLVDIDFGEDYSLEDGSYEGIMAVFCPLDFAAQKKKPPEQPMFKDVVANSKCDKQQNVVRVDLAEAYALAAEFDADNAGDLPHVLDLKGAVFHESRCGSTLAANALLALEPARHRVYSESAPPAAALRACGEDYDACSPAAAARLLQDIVYLMGRSGDPQEERLFFEFQSITTRTLETFRQAFPTTPWIFLYRDPVEVMTSQLRVPKTAQANCVRAKRRSPAIRNFIARTEYALEEFSDEEVCAVHLATLCEAAERHLDDAAGTGAAVRYTPDLASTLLDNVFFAHFGTPVDQAGRDRAMKVAGTYSKNRGKQEEGGFQPDTEAKARRASQEIKDAAKEYLEPSYRRLQHSPYNIDPVYDDDKN